MGLALVRDMRELRAPSSEDEVAAFETDVLAGFVLARASAGLADSTIRNDTGHLDLIRDWFGRPLREMQPENADACFGRVLRDAKPATRTGRAAALTVYFQFLELRHRAEIYNLTGWGEVVRPGWTFLLKAVGDGDEVRRCEGRVGVRHRLDDEQLSVLRPLDLAGEG